MNQREALHAALNPCLKNETWGTRLLQNFKGSITLNFLVTC